MAGPWGLLSVSGNHNGGPCVWISEQEMCATIWELLALGRRKGHEGQAEETFKGAFLTTWTQQ